MRRVIFADEKISESILAVQILLDNQQEDYRLQYKRNLVVS